MDLYPVPPSINVHQMVTFSRNKAFIPQSMYDNMDIELFEE
ncbi:hypothetical protein [Metabacillus indicus]|nr:hypothetical protein [Metabacillus indicus]